MSKVEVNQISSQCGSTLTIGQSGDTVQLASGASQTGFGRTGTVNWDTTAKTTSFTAVSGNGYFVNTTSGAITVTLPASPSAGDIVGIKDYASTFDTNNVTVARNSSNIDGGASDATLNEENLSVFFVYVDGTQGWKATQSDAGFYGQLFVTATGGTVTTSGNFKIHTFTSPGTFTVTCAGNPAGSDTVDYLVVAGGGGGGYNRSGGGGAGGFRESCGAASGCYTTSPLAKSCGALPISVQGYPITVGSGGAAGPTPGTPGSSGANSVFSTITSAGGGGGADGNDGSPVNGLAGGSGGGGAACSGPVEPQRNGGAGNTPPVSPPQGNPGGNSGAAIPATCAGAGGGGATAAGTNATDNTGKPGGAGAGTAINPAVGEPGPSCVQYFSGGGGGGGHPSGGPSSTGGIGGGADGSYGTNPISNATANTGGGGGGTGPGPSPIRATNGGSGIVVIRYKYQ